MAEKGKEKELEFKDQEGDPADATPEKFPKKKLIKIGGGVVSALVLSAVAYFFFLGGDSAGSGEDLAEEDAVPLEKAEYLEFDPPFIINLPDRGRQRFLQASVTVMTRNRRAYLTIEEHMPAMRHSISRVLSAQSIDSIQSPGGIEQVRREATIELNKILLEEFGSAEIEAVLFTSFVMQ